MKIINSFKKLFCIFLSAVLIFCCCACSSNENRYTKNLYNVFTENKNGNLISADGVEYTYLSNEIEIKLLGETEFKGGVVGEEKTTDYWGVESQNGLFSIKGDKSENVLLRKYPNDEWCGIYRKASLPKIDFSIDKCIRIEFVYGESGLDSHEIHAKCGDGITDNTEIARFFSEIKSQKSPEEAGLYDLITEADGTLKNCSTYGAIYGFFEEEPNLAISMPVTTYNYLAYSVSIDGKEYVLPKEWIEKL